MKRMSDVRFEAFKRFDPKTLCAFLTRRPSGVVCVDKEKCAPTIEDKILFSVTMHFVYGWWYQDFDTCTIFLEEDKGRIYGGIYDLANEKKLTHRLISVSESAGVSDLYTYDQSAFECMRVQIRDAI